MTTTGRWSPTKIRKRTLSSTWTDAEEALGGMVLMTPSSIVSSGPGNSSSISANGSVTFSSCSTLSLNGIFTTEYDNYILIARGSTTTNSGIGVRLRASGTDATGSNYTQQYLYANSSSVTGARTTGATGFDLCGAWGSGLTQSGDCVYFYGPFLAQPTAIRSIDISGDTTNVVRLYDVATTHSLSSSYDGLTFIPNSGQMSGTMSVYGLGG